MGFIDVCAVSNGFWIQVGYTVALTKQKIDAAKPTDKRYRISDGGGLVLSIEPSGRKVWRFRYQRNGKDAVTTLGAYPEITLLDARAKALDLKRAQGQGDDPATELKRDAERNRTIQGERFKDVAEAFMEREKPHWAEGHHERFQNRMVRDVFPIIGDMPVATIQPIDVTRAIAGIEARGAQDTAVRVAGMIGQVLRYGVAKGLCQRDVTADLRGGLDRPPPTKHMAAVIDREELGRLLADIWDWGGDSYGKPLLQLAAYLFQRPGENQAMKWADVDLDAGLWTYRVSKVDIAHAVPLPPQAVAILRDLHTQTGKFENVFYSRTAKSQCVSPQIAVKLLGKIGWRDKQTVHGFRAVARTVIAEDLRVEPRLIEQQLSHGVAEVHGRAYNRTQHLPERQAMMAAYADRLDELRRAAL